jgi:hypothetical protein
MEINIGLCEAYIDLGGLPLRYLDLNVGATECLLEFTKKNPEIADEIFIDAGAAEFEIKGLGRANFERFSFDGGVGDFDLDFSGDYSLHSEARISVGLGEATIRIPNNLPVRIITDDNFLSSVDFKNADDRYLDDGYYETEDFERSSAGLEIDVSVGLGSVEIIFED